MRGDKKGIFSLPAVMILLKELYYKEGKPTVFYSKKLDITYSHINKMVKEMAKIGLLMTKKLGRTQNLTLTEQGRKTAIACCVVSMGFKGEQIGNIKTISGTKETVVSDPKRVV